MELSITYTFRGKQYSCAAFIDASEFPCYIFTIQTDNEIIEEFGIDVSIKTNCVTVLPKKDDYSELLKLRVAIFEAIKTLPEIITAKEKFNAQPG